MEWLASNPGSPFQILSRSFGENSNAARQNPEAMEWLGDWGLQ